MADLDGPTWRIYVVEPARERLWQDIAALRSGVEAHADAYSAAHLSTILTNLDAARDAVDAIAAANGNPNP